MVDRFQWPARMVADGTPLEWLFRFDLDVAPDRLWPHLIDMSRFNRALGLSRMEFEERDGVLHGSGKSGGMRHLWIEEPWEWVDGDHLIIVRRYSKGFSRWLRVIYALEPLPAGRTRIRVYFGWIPRGWFGAMCLKIGMPPLEREYGRVLEHLASAEPGGGELYDRPADELSPDARARVATIRETLTRQGLDGSLVQRLTEHIARGDAMEVHRIQVRRLAHAWGVPEDALLSVALHATRAGLLNMSWDVICPHCRGVRDEGESLAHVAAVGRCDVCEIDFETDQDNALEITFHAHPSIRDAQKIYYCSAEPSTKLHIKLKQRVAAGASRTVPLSLPPGRFRLRTKGAKRYGQLLVSEDGPVEVAWDAATDELALTCATSASITLRNGSEEPRGFIIEEPAWSDEALRPVQLFSFQEFRDLFSQEYMATDVHLSVGRQTILFTDIVGSTRFYACRGDPEAFMEVKRHFAEAQAIVAANRGAMVKTIGDAIMASFSDPINALRASKAIHECFHSDRADSPVRVRISLNTGPCIAVKLNADIDFFGNSVNLAAKLQACCEAGEIAFSEQTFHAPGVAEYLAEEGAALETFEYESKSLLAPITVKRWTIYAPGDVVLPEAVTAPASR